MTTAYGVKSGANLPTSFNGFGAVATSTVNLPLASRIRRKIGVVSHQGWLLWPSMIKALILGRAVAEFGSAFAARDEATASSANARAERTRYISARSRGAAQ